MRAFPIYSFMFVFIFVVREQLPFPTLLLYHKNENKSNILVKYNIKRPIFKPFISIYSHIGI